MPHTASAWKRLREAEKRKAQNRAAAKKIKVARKAVATALAGTDAAAVTAEVRNTQAVLDRAAAKGYIHKNKAARLKSRLVKRMRAATGQVFPALRDPTTLRKWKRIMSKFKPLSDARRATLAREDVALDGAYPGEYVAYVDVWAGDVLTRRVVAHAPDSETFHRQLAGLESPVRAAVELTRTAEADESTQNAFRFV